MAGLQQYNFFPTDLFYPRPQPSSSKPTALPMQTPKVGDIISTEDLHPQKQQQQQQQQPSSMVKVPPSGPAVVYSQKMQSLSGVDEKLSKFSTNPLSWVVWMAEEEGSDIF